MERKWHFLTLETYPVDELVEEGQKILNGVEEGTKLRAFIKFCLNILKTNPRSFIPKKVTNRTL